MPRPGCCCMYVLVFLIITPISFERKLLFMLFFFPLDFSTCLATRRVTQANFLWDSQEFICVSNKNLHRAPESDDFRPTHTLALNFSIRATQSASQSSFIMLQEPVYTSFRRALVSLPVTTPTPSSHHCTTVSCTLVVFKLIKLTTWLEFIYLSERVQQAMIVMLMH